jgi:hypothetical protein
MSLGWDRQNAAARMRFAIWQRIGDVLYRLARWVERLGADAKMRSLGLPVETRRKRLRIRFGS